VRYEIRESFKPRPVTRIRDTRPALSDIPQPGIDNAFSVQETSVFGLPECKKNLAFSLFT
jgi:hypothetical protein